MQMCSSIYTTTIIKLNSCSKVSGIHILLLQFFIVLLLDATKYDNLIVNF